MFSPVKVKRVGVRGPLKNSLMERSSFPRVGSSMVFVAVASVSLPALRVTVIDFFCKNEISGRESLLK